MCGVKIRKAKVLLEPWVNADAIYCSGILLTKGRMDPEGVTTSSLTVCKVRAKHLVDCISSVKLSNYDNAKIMPIVCQ